MEVRLSSYRWALGEVLVELGREFKDLIVLDADTPKSTGTILFAKEFPRRFINVGISEQDLICVAAGLALSGKVPVATAFAMFLMRAWEQIRNTVVRMKLNVKLVGTHAGLSAFMDGSSHQVLEDIALMRVLPYLTVVAPADSLAVKELIKQVVMELHGPAYVRLGRDNAIEVYGRYCDNELRLGKANIIKEGNDVNILAYGSMVGVALLASEILRKEYSLSTGVVDAHTIKPLDKLTIINVARKSNLLVVLEEHKPVGGLSSAIAELLTEVRLSTPLLKLGVTKPFGRSARNYWQLLDYVGLSPKHVVKEVLEVIK